MNSTRQPQQIVDEVIFLTSADYPTFRFHLMQRFEIFTEPNCTFCEQAKLLLIVNQLEFIEWSISNEGHLKEYRRRLPQNPSVPQIFVNGEHIGNEQELANFIRHR